MIRISREILRAHKLLAYFAHSRSVAHVEHQASLQKSAIVASATVRMLARQHNIDLQQLKGTGRKGRILKDDIVYFLQRQSNTTPKQLIGKLFHDESQPKYVKDQVKRVQMNESEKQLCKLYNASTRIPHLYLQETFRVDEIIKMIELFGQRNTKISVLSVLIKTFSLALLEHPRINSTYNLNSPFSFNRHTIQNLIIPSYQQTVHFSSIQNLQQLSVLQIEESLNSVEKRSYSNNLSSYIRKATVCIQNLGGIAVNPLIVGEYSCHASVGRVRDAVRPLQGQFSKEQVVDVTLGCDHRVLDGAAVARFLVTWKQFSQNPALAFVKMV